MDYSDLEEEVVARLDSLNTSDCKVLAQPENQQDFKRTVEKARITVAYIGSKGDKITATDLVRQSENVCVEVVIQARKLRGVGYSVLKLIASVKALLIGWKAMNCNRMYFDDAGIVDYVEGVFTYSVKFKCESEIWQLEEEQIAPLIKSITVADTVTDIPVPTNLSVQVIEGIAIISWDAMEGVDSYIVYVDGTFLTNIDITQVSYGSIVNGNSYTFEVFSVKNGKVGESASVVLEYSFVVPGKVTGLTGTVVNDDEIQWEWDAVSGADKYILEINGSDFVTISTNSYRQTDTTSANSFTGKVSAVDNDVEGPQSDAVVVELKMNLVQFLNRINRYERGIFLLPFRESNLQIDGSGNVSKASDLGSRAIDFQQLTASEQPAFEAPNKTVHDSTDELVNETGANVFSTSGGSLFVAMEQLPSGSTFYPFELTADGTDWRLYVTRGAGIAAGPTFYLELRGTNSGTIVLGGRGFISNLIGNGNGEGLEPGSKLYIALIAGDNGDLYLHLYGKTPSTSYAWGSAKIALNYEWFGVGAPYTNLVYGINMTGGSGTAKYNGFAAFDTANLSESQIHQICNLIVEDQLAIPENSLLSTLNSISAIDEIVYACNFMDSSLVEVDGSNNLIRPIDLSKNGIDFTQRGSANVTYDSGNGLILLNTSNADNNYISGIDYNFQDIGIRGHYLAKINVGGAIGNNTSSRNNVIFRTIKVNITYIGIIINCVYVSASKYRLWIHSDNRAFGGADLSWYNDYEFDIDTDYQIDLFWDLSNNPVLRVDGVEQSSWSVSNTTDPSSKPVWLGNTGSTRSAKTYAIGEYKNDLKLKGLVIVSTQTPLSIAESQSIFDQMITPA